MTFRLSSLPFAAAVTALVLVAAGCGADEPTAGQVSSPPSPSSQPSSTETPTPDATPTSGLGGTAAPSPTPTPEPSPTPTPTPYDGPPRTYEEALALFDRASGTQELSRFASPSGNLYCVLDSPFLPPSCELGTGAIPDAVVCPADGPSQNVGRIEFTEAAPQPVCNSDTIREPGAPVLGYSGVATWPDTTVTCVMEDFGVTCVNPPASQGFFLAKGRYQVF